MVVCYSVNDNYFDLFEVSLKSLLHHNQVSKVYVLHSNLSKNLIYKCELIASDNCQIVFIQINKGLFKDIEVKYVGVEAYYRLLLPNLITDKKVWYLDVDTLILDSIEKPFNDDLLTPLAAVPKFNQDSLSERKFKIGLKEDLNYFNSGVLLLNLDLIGREKIFQKVIDWRSKNVLKTDMADQDALNVIFAGQYLELDLSYNVTSEIAKEFKNPKIAHFTGQYKPNLIFYSHPFKKYFKQYFIYNKKSYSIKLNAAYIVSQSRSILATKLPFTRKIYRKLKGKS